MKRPSRKKLNVPKNRKVKRCHEWLKTATKEQKDQYHLSNSAFYLACFFQELIHRRLDVQAVVARLNRGENMYSNPPITEKEFKVTGWADNINSGINDNFRTILEIAYSADPEAVMELMEEFNTDLESTIKLTEMLKDCGKS